MIHIAALSVLAMQVYPSCQVQLGLLLANKAPIKVPFEYLDYADVCLFNLVMKLPENTDINKHTIKLVKC